MTLSPQAARAIALAGDLPTGLTPQELRVVYTTERMKLQPPRPAVQSVTELDIPGRAGPIPARVYVPRNDQAIQTMDQLIQDENSSDDASATPRS